VLGTRVPEMQMAIDDEVLLAILLVHALSSRTVVSRTLAAARPTRRVFWAACGGVRGAIRGPSGQAPRSSGRSCRVISAHSALRFVRVCRCDPHTCSDAHWAHR